MKFSYSFIKKLLSEAPPKAKLADGLNSYSLETENLDGDLLDISLPSNRYSDSASHLGIAREVTAIFGSNPHTKFGAGVKLKNPVKTIVNPPADQGLLEVKIENKNFCPRYAARYFKNVKIGNSPAWMQEILRTCGLKPINNVVDLMNFVMLEVGQPLHAFDFDKLSAKRDGNPRIHANAANKKTIVVRKAKNGEKIETLDGQKLVLDENDSVIADGEKALAIAGIKGGANSGVDKNTKRIIVEAANFDPVSTFKTSRKLKLITDASLRFDHGLSPALVDWGIDRATELLVKMGAKLVDSVDSYPKRAGDELIEFDIKKYEELIGAPVSSSAAENYFLALGFSVESSKSKNSNSALALNRVQGFLVRVPAWRTDIAEFEDLAEEISRLSGYNRLKSQSPAVSLRPAGEENSILLKDKIRYFLLQFGLNEVYNYSFVSDDGNRAVELENPLSQELKYLRQTLEGGLLKNIADNSRFFDEARVFEIGKVFETESGGIRETLHLGIALGGKKPLVLELKGIVDELLKGLGISDFSIIEAGGRQGLRVEIGKLILGNIRFVELEKKLLVVVCEINLDALLPLLDEEREFKPLPKYPAIVRDISILVGSDARIGAILQAIQDASPKLIENVDLIDEYQDEKLGGKQSLTFRIVFQSEERTLTDAEVNREMEKISGALKKKFGAEVR